MIEQTTDTNPFCAALTNLCRQHGFGIEGGTLYLMEPDDSAANYTSNADSALIRA